MMLFDNFVRTHKGRDNFGESEFEFLNRSAHPEAEKARARTESLFSRYPKPGLKHLVARLKSDSQNFQGAIFELVLHGLLIDLGFEVEVCDLDNSRPRPDFLVKSEDKRCYVEGTVVDPQTNTLGSNVYEEDVINKLDALGGRGFGLAVELEGTLNRLLPKPSVVEPFRSLMNEVDAREIKPITGMGSLRTAPFAQIQDSDWTLTSRLFAIDSDRFVHMQEREPKIVHPEKALVKRITDKAKNTARWTHHLSLRPTHGN